MKKLLLAILVSSSLIAYADDCADLSNKIVKRMHKKGVQTVTLSYSSDKAALAQSCQQDVASKDSSLKLVLKPTDGTNVFKFSRD